MTLEQYVNAYQQYFYLARKIANDILHDYHLSGDVAQEVFSEMFVKMDKLDFEQIKFWVILNANRRAIDQTRRSYRKKELSSDADGNEARSPLESEDMILRQEYYEYQCAALAELKIHNKEWFDILIRHHVWDESYKSLAKYYGITNENLRVQVHRARKWLEKKVEELYDTPD